MAIILGAKPCCLSRTPERVIEVWRFGLKVVVQFNPPSLREHSKIISKKPKGHDENLTCWMETAIMYKLSPLRSKHGALVSSSKPLCSTEFRAISQRSTEVKCQSCLAMLYLPSMYSLMNATYVRKC